MIKRITLKDISKKADTSIRTVTRVLNNAPFVKEDTRKKVLKIIDELNYHPNLIARGLKSNISKSIGIVYADFGSGMFNKIIKGIESISEKDGYLLMVTDSKFDIHVQNKNIENLISRMIDGLIILPCNNDFSYIEVFDKYKVPVVTIGMIPKEIEGCCIYTDEGLGMDLVVNYLVLKGHKKIAFINFNGDFISTDIRLQSYKSSLAVHNINFDKNYVFYSGPFIDDGYKTAKMIFEQKQDFSAISCWNDQIAIGVLKYCKENKIRVPDDISIIGFDDDRETNDYLSVPLTTIHCPKFKLGIEVAKLMFEQINNNKTRNKHLRLEPYIVERESVKNINV